MRAFDRALKRLGIRRRTAAPANAVDLKVNRRGRRHWTAGVSFAPPEPEFGATTRDHVISIVGLELGPVDLEEIMIACDRPLSDYAPQPNPEPTPPAPAPFDPVRAWADVGLAWLRCAHAVAEIPAQLALYHRVRVVGLL